MTVLNHHDINKNLNKHNDNGIVFYSPTAGILNTSICEKPKTDRNSVYLLKRRGKVNNKTNIFKSYDQKLWWATEEFPVELPIMEELNNKYPIESFDLTIMSYEKMESFVEDIFTVINSIGKKQKLCCLYRYEDNLHFTSSGNLLGMYPKDTKEFIMDILVCNSDLIMKEFQADKNRKSFIQFLVRRFLIKPQDILPQLQVRGRDGIFLDRWCVHNSSSEI